MNTQLKSSRNALRDRSLLCEVSKINDESRPVQFSDSDELNLSLRQTIGEKGILTPLLVCKEGDRYRLIDGFLRLAVAKELGLKAVPITIADTATEGDVIRAAIASNVSRQWTPRDYLTAANKLREVYPKLKGKRSDLNNEASYCSTLAIAQILGIHQRAIERYEQVDRFSPQLLDAVSEGSVPFSSALTISRAYSVGSTNRHSLQEIIERSGEVLGANVSDMGELLQSLKDTSGPLRKDKKALSSPKEIDLFLPESKEPKALTEHCHQCTFFKELLK